MTKKGISLLSLAMQNLFQHLFVSVLPSIRHLSPYITPIYSVSFPYYVTLPTYSASFLPCHAAHFFGIFPPYVKPIYSVSFPYYVTLPTYSVSFPYYVTLPTYSAFLPSYVTPLISSASFLPCHAALDAASR